MLSIFKMGGPLFMGLLTGILFIIIALTVYFLFLVLRKDYKDLNEIRKKIAYLKSIGLFGMITGILGQMVGLFSAFSAVEQAIDISPAIMAGGLKVSMITPIYGVLIFLISYLVWFLVDVLASREA